MHKSHAPMSAISQLLYVCTPYKYADTAATSETNDEEECGSCYGDGDEGECCNTCDDVKRLCMGKNILHLRHPLSSDIKSSASN